MQSLVKLNGIYYFRLRVPHDVKEWFPYPTLKKSLRVKRYDLAKGLVRNLLGKSERVFSMIRSKTLDANAVQKIVADFMESVLELKYDSAEDTLYESYEIMQDIYSDSQKATVDAVKRRKEVGLSDLPFTALNADYLCTSAGYEPIPNTPEYKMLVHQLSIAKRDIIATLQERLDTGDSKYDIEQRKRKEKELEERSKSDTLSTLIASYCEAKDNVKGKGRKSKLQEKMEKFKGCFEYETGKKDILLSDIDYKLTVKIGKRLAQYPCHRNTGKNTRGKTLDQIYSSEGIEYPKDSTVREELYRLSGLFTFAINTCEGLKKNYAADLADVVLGKQTDIASEARDVFRINDLKEILQALNHYKDKGYFNKNPHLLYITLIGLYQGARINEICQLNIDDITIIDGIPCISHQDEESEDKSFKTANSKRINPIHPALIDFGLLRFRDSQAAKGHKGLWDGAANHSCAFYGNSGNCSHYVGKWWNGTFKTKLKLSNPDKQSFHSTRHTFINWFYQNVKQLDYTARDALSGHLNKEDLAALRLQGFNVNSEGVKTYSKGLNVKRQLELLQQLDYGIDLSKLKVI